MKKKLKSNLFIGVLSGTSADSIDAGLFKVDKKISFLNFASTKYDEKLKDAILDISRNKKLPSKGVLKDIDNKVGEISAKTINKLIKLYYCYEFHEFRTKTLTDRTFNQLDLWRRLKKRVNLR